MKHILFLVKFFKEELHANEFRKGTLYAKQLSYYKKIEDDARIDESEGIIVHAQPGKHHIKIGGWDLTPDICGPTEIFSNELNSLRIFCMTAGYINEQEFEAILAKTAPLNIVKEKLRIHEDCLKFGKYAVIVLNIPEFIERVKGFAIAHNYSVTRGFVQYYDPIIEHVHFSKKDAPFRKRTKFANEKEYRFVFQGFPTRTIEIGDISHITMPIEANSINDAISNMTLTLAP